jgi:hypothetical protein
MRMEKPHPASVVRESNMAIDRPRFTHECVAGYIMSVFIMFTKVVDDGACHRVIAISASIPEI